jgi:alpha-galactosidase
MLLRAVFLGLAARALAAVQKAPVMGWSGYNALMQNSGECARAGGYNETTFLETAAALKSSGLAAKGYIFLNADDCWIAQNRTADGKLAADAVRFPHGMAWLAAQLHGAGLKLGLYAAASVLTCRGYPGSQGYEEVDAATFASWGADFAKLDSCTKDPLADGAESWYNQYTRWSAALASSGRDIVFSCSWAYYWARCVRLNGAAACGQSPLDNNHIASICNMWRYANDLEPTWTNGYGGIYDLLVDAAVSPVTAAFRAVTGPGAVNDPDFLVVGCALDGPCEPDSPHPLPALTQVQQRTQFSMWCVLGAPLIVGSDIRHMDAFTLETLGNADAIAISQDARFARPRTLNGTAAQGDARGAVWARDLLGGDAAVALLNLGAAPLALGLNLTQLGWAAGAAGSVLDVWSKVRARVDGPTFSAVVPPFTATLLRFSLA